MYHYVAHAVPGRLLFDRWSEARLLWDRLLIAAPGSAAIILMLDHYHLLHRERIDARLQYAMRGHARTLNRMHRRPGRLWVPMPEPHLLVGRQKCERSERYVHLNANRAGLVTDPLEWPFSTYRDALALAPAPVRRPATDVHRYHEWTCRDDRVPAPMPLPVGGLVAEGPEGMHRVMEALSSISRTPLPWFARRGRPRGDLIRCLRLLSDASTRDIADFVGVTTRAVRATQRREDGLSRLVERAMTDRRFAGLADDDLTLRPEFWRYRSNRRG